MECKKLNKILILNIVILMIFPAYFKTHKDFYFIMKFYYITLLNFL